MILIKQKAKKIFLFFFLPPMSWKTICILETKSATSKAQAQMIVVNVKWRHFEEVGRTSTAWILSEEEMLFRCSLKTRILSSSFSNWTTLLLPSTCIITKSFMNIYIQQRWEIVLFIVLVDSKKINKNLGINCFWHSDFNYVWIKSQCKVVVFIYWKEAMLN